LSSNSTKLSRPPVGLTTTVRSPALPTLNR